MPEPTPGPTPKPKSRGARRRSAKAEATPAPTAAAMPPASTAPEPEGTPPTRTRPAAVGEGTAAAEPVPLEVPLEEQISGLPALEYPGNPNEDFVLWAADKRRGRIRVEIIGGAFLVMAGVAASIFTGHSAFILIALFAVAGLAAYEFLVTSFE